MAVTCLGCDENLFSTQLQIVKDILRILQGAVAQGMVNAMIMPSLQKREIVFDSNH